MIRARITYDRLLTVEGHEAGAAALIGAIHTLVPFDPTCEATLHTTAAPPAPAVFGLDPTFQIGAEFDYEHTFESP